MILEKITTMEQLEALKPWDIIIVKWDDYFVKHHEKAQNIMPYRIADVNRGSQLEIICQIKGNHYFAADRFLEGLSSAKEVYIVKEEPNE